MLSPGDMRRGDDSLGGADQLFRSITRLVANSGVQFIDIALPRTVIESVSRSFGVERVSVQDASIWALAPASPGDDLEGVGITRLRIDGRSAVQAAGGRWLPLPLLRFVARDGDGRPQFDDGPCNWARLYVSDADGDQSVVRGVIAIDTAIDPQSRLDIDSYQAPTADDARFISTFVLTDDAQSLAPFLAEDWVQDWISQVFPIAQMRRGGGVQTARSHPEPQSAQEPAHQALQQMASYLALLTVVRRAGVLPSLQFFDTRVDVVPTVPVDIVLDIGQARTCGMTVECGSDGGRPVLENASLLALRDLSHPVDIHYGAFDSRMEFARATFGPEALSRRSGRADAFHWPSLARIGPEAVKLARDTRASDGATGLAAPKRHLADQALRPETWRFALDQRVRAQRSPMLSGRMLSHTNETAGRLLTGPAGSVQPLSLRPRFSLSSMMSFFIAEIVLQALSTINAPVVDAGRLQGAANARRAEGVRRLRQIVICAPLTLPLDERQLLRDRAEAAVDMLWRALGWDEATAGVNPPRPTVRLGLDETLAAQLAYLFDEVGQRFGGDARAAMNLIGKTRPDFGVEPCLRVGALDVGGGHTTMTIVTYAQSTDRSLAPALLGAQRSDLGGEAVLERLVAELILPAVSDALAARGMKAPALFLAQLAAHPGPGASYDVAAVSTRLYEHWLRPAAIGLLGLAADASPTNATARLSMSILDLARRAGGQPNAQVDDDFRTAAAEHTVADFSLGDVALAVRIADITMVCKGALAPMVARLSRALVASDCDVVLLTGWSSRLTVIRDLLLEAMPWRPDRIIASMDRDWLDWYPMSHDARRLADGKDVALIGALLALSGGGLGFGADADAQSFSDMSFGEPAVEDPASNDPLSNDPAFSDPTFSWGRP